MGELEERVERLENELALLKVNIKHVLVELKELVTRDQNPLADMSFDHHKPVHDTPVIIMSS